MGAQNKSGFRSKVEGSCGTVQLCQAIVDAAHSIEDYDWLLTEYKMMQQHNDKQVKGGTVTCLGHLARLNPNANGSQLLSILHPLRLDIEIRGLVEEAISDVETFAEG